MSKKAKKAANAPAKRESKRKEESESPAATVERPAVQGYLIRAIKITPEILSAAKAYRKDKGVSFYTLGLESIQERLGREGYLKPATAKA